MGRDWHSGFVAICAVSSEGGILCVFQPFPPVPQSAPFSAKPRSQASWDGVLVNLYIKQRDSTYTLYINGYWSKEPCHS